MKRIFALLLLVPGTLSAQSRTTVTGYVATDGSMETKPLLVGATVAAERGLIAARLSTGFDISAPPPVPTDGTERPASGIWTSDADVLLFMGSPRSGRSIVPYALLGIGVRGMQADGSLGAGGNYSYGAGFRAPLLGAFSIEGEARYRNTFAETSARDVPVIQNAMEFRVGFNFGFGGRSSLGPALPPRPNSVPRGRMLTSDDERTRLVGSMLTTAERYIGVPYLWGGNTPQQGFDCSGFIRYVFDQHGVAIPRVSVDQARHGRGLPLDISAFQPGDILAFASDGRTVDHTAIYAGGGRIIHSSSSGDGVRYDDLYSARGSWYVEHMVAARRVIEEGMYLSAN